MQEQMQEQRRKGRVSSGTLAVTSRYRNSANVNVERRFATPWLASRASREKTWPTGFAEESENWLEIGEREQRCKPTLSSLFLLLLPCSFLSRRLWKNQRQERRRKMLVCAFTDRAILNANALVRFSIGLV